jgi:hypothetical protein
LLPVLTPKSADWWNNRQDSGNLVDQKYETFDSDSEIRDFVDIIESMRGGVPVTNWATEVLTEEQYAFAVFFANYPKKFPKLISAGEDKTTRKNFLQWADLYEASKFVLYENKVNFHGFLRNVHHKPIYGSIWKALTPSVTDATLAAAQTNWMMNERQFLGIYWSASEKRKIWQEWKSEYAKEYEGEYNDFKQDLTGAEM